MPDVLAFSDRRSEGAFPVADASGEVVASIRVARWSGASFTATTTDGGPLCSGRHRGWLSTWWDAADPQGAPLCSLKSGVWGTRRRVLLPGRPELTLTGQWFGRDWSMTDAAGTPVLLSEPSTGPFSLRPDAWVVRCLDPSLTLAQVVAVVETNRLLVKASRASAAAG